ncbi:MAG: DUF1553 domain-containing protein [Acidobacteria bacterium]|nr:DUF1553 domain-containing protein [Acidobacteriota bacterium]
MLGWISTISLLAAGAPAAPPDAVGRLLATQCAKCHGAGSAHLSDFDISSRDSLLKGGKHGPAIVPGDASGSRLYQWIVEGKMPPGEKLDAATTTAVGDWINAGAPWDGGKTTSNRQRWWAFEPPLKRTPPAIAGAANPIDAFLLAKLREKRLDFNPPADPRTLIRRLYFDLTGLPPKSEDYGQTYQQAVERLLQSRHYGERWARHWLDVVRFGETDGGEHNYERMNAWPYRDWVIESLNQDKPYDQFIREQIAGDVLNPEDPKTVAATGFLVAGPWDSVSAVLNKDETLRLQARMDELDDMVTTVGHSFLALTVNCARCHDHKFDPIPSRDYYRMTAFFSAVGFGEREVATGQQRKLRAEYLKPLRKEMDEARKRLADIEDPVRARLLITRYQEFDRQRAGEPRRIAVNPIWNRNQFSETRARCFRFVISSHGGKKAHLDFLELSPAGHRIENWTAEETATPDKPQTIEIRFQQPGAVSEIRFSSDLRRGSKDGAVSVYRLDASDDGQVWRTLCSSLDHVGNVEVELPTVSGEEIEAALTPEARTERSRMLAEIERLQRNMDEAPAVVTLYAAKPRELEKAYLLERGNVKRPVEEVSPGVLSALGGEPLPADSKDAGPRRLALANWIASSKNPLTARVVVNRVWYYHFGNGIVNTPSDFGVNGDRPSHPELLDWLAVAFIENGWSLKWLHRQIVSTLAYQQSAAIEEKAFAIDAGNRLVWRMPLKRMDAEMLRDSILDVSGNLNPEASGPSFLLQKKGSRGSYIYAALNNDGPEVWRRAVYRLVVRGGERIMMDSFDCPDPSVATPQRAISNTPVQALALMNNEFVIRQAGLFARRLEREAPRGRTEQIRLAYHLLYGRKPEAKEIERDAGFIAAQSLAAYARVLLNSNEFIYVP